MKKTGKNLRPQKYQAFKNKDAQKKIAFTNGKNEKVDGEKINTTHISPTVYLIMDAWWDQTVQKECFLSLSRFPKPACAQVASLAVCSTYNKIVKR